MTPPAPKPTVMLTVSGRVQGVNFRSTIAEYARALNLTGYASNNPDGTVTIVAQGAANDLRSFTHRCRTVPPPAKIELITVQWPTNHPPYSHFSIR